MAKKAAASPEDGGEKQPTRGEIYKTNRPTEFSQIVGQPAAVRLLEGFVAAKEVPRFLLFTGPSGVGKTTLARILRVKLGCADGFDFHEINCASARGIDTVRAIEDEMTTGALMGRAVVYLLDEVHAMTKDAFQGMLKLLEDVPKHVYFMACTTDPAKIPKTIKTRATEVALNAVGAADLSKLVKREAELAAITLTPEALARIVDSAEGSPRLALVMLNTLKAAPNGDTDAQLALLKVTDRYSEVITFARTLGDPNATLDTVIRCLKALPDGTDSEGVRRVSLGYWNSVFLGGNRAARTIRILQEFTKHTYDNGMPGITLACINVFRS